ncbi:FH protein interacting protein FIP2-like isoform X3 [Zingiber officinale]|uniref:FH protein interacting protein FIP2-like isoform X3 n=1 Tax=Zingiber officinale TaxID=94328 RepID=UPI001C4C37D4|nr:FH protein interacting protein FIP2-like isoform X3 [Zingiber officinale]
MEPGSPWPSSQVFLNVGRSIIPGGKKYTTTIDTLTQREPDSMLAAMFSGRYTVSTDDKTGMIFIDRDGKHFRHILNWLRDGIIPMLQDSDYQELIREAEYYQLLGLIENINANLCNRKDKDAPVVELTELTRKEVIQIIQSEKVRFRGVNLSGLDLSKLKTNFSRANLNKAKFGDAEAGGSIFEDANLRECELIGADLHQAKLDRANLQSANLQDACLTQCSLCDADLRSAHLQSAKLSGANLQGANLEGANLKGAKLNSANLQDANLQRAYLREVDLRDSQLEGAKMGGANLLGVIR